MERVANGGGPHLERLNMKTKRIVSRRIVISGDERFVVAISADGTSSQLPVSKTKPVRKPRLRRQKLFDRSRKKSF